MMFCNQCGKPLNETAKFCPECGAGVARVEVQAAEPEVQAPIPDRSVANSWKKQCNFTRVYLCISSALLLIPALRSLIVLLTNGFVDSSYLATSFLITAFYLAPAIAAFCVFDRMRKSKDIPLALIILLFLMQVVLTIVVSFVAWGAFEYSPDITDMKLFVLAVLPVLPFLPVPTMIAFYSFNQNNLSSHRRKWPTFILCLFFGVAGFHKLYIGKLAIGTLYFLTAGFFGIGVLVDLIRILIDSEKDFAARSLT